MIIRLIKEFITKRRVITELIDIIDECQKENILLRKQATDFRTRAIEAETIVERQFQTIRNLRQDPRPTG